MGVCGPEGAGGCGWSAAPWRSSSRVVSKANRTCRVATNSFLAEGGDRYDAFKNGRQLAEDALLSDCVLDHLRRVETITPLAPSRLVSI